MNKDAKKIYLGVYGICLLGDKVLVIKKSRGPYFGKFDLPGGGLNFEETVSECLARELMEETNTKIKKDELMGINEYQCQYEEEKGVIKDFHHIGIYFRVDLEIDKLKIEPDGQDSEGALFIDITELTSNNTSPIALPMIMRAKDMLGFFHK